MIYISFFEKTAHLILYRKGLDLFGNKMHPDFCSDEAKGNYDEPIFLITELRNAVYFIILQIS